METEKTVKWNDQDVKDIGKINAMVFVVCSYRQQLQELDEHHRGLLMLEALKVFADGMLTAKSRKSLLVQLYGILGVSDRLCYTQRLTDEDAVKALGLVMNFTVVAIENLLTSYRKELEIADLPPLDESDDIPY